MSWVGWRAVVYHSLILLGVVMVTEGGDYRSGLDPRSAKIQTRDFGALGNVIVNQFKGSDYSFVDGVCSFQMEAINLLKSMSVRQVCSGGERQKQVERFGMSLGTDRSQVSTHPIWD